MKRPCVTCDLQRVASLEMPNERPGVEQALTVAYKLASELGLPGVKETLCAHHRLNYVLALAFGAKNIQMCPACETTDCRCTYCGAQCSEECEPFPEHEYERAK